MPNLVLVELAASEVESISRGGSIARRVLWAGYSSECECSSGPKHVIAGALCRSSYVYVCTVPFLVWSEPWLNDRVLQIESGPPSRRANSVFRESQLELELEDRPSNEEGPDSERKRRRSRVHKVCVHCWTLMDLES